ncbi:MAG: helix-turn-helix transcriptional regulator, partial [Chloroflexi bacterium]|nr:helix-turn-helix transcriptional regulator [Chloroflexota bacterium]
WRYIGEGERLLAGVSAPHRVVERAQQFIHLHLIEPITLPEIATAAAVSESHLIRLFRTQLGVTPIAYLWDQRVALGIELLERSGLSVTEIARRSGFQTSYHFARRIRQATGLAPLAVRKRAWERH